MIPSTGTLAVSALPRSDLEISRTGPNFDPATEEEQGQLDELDPKWIDCPHCGKEFDMRGQV